MKDFRELKVWQKAHQLTRVVYRITADCPREELYGLTSQLPRLIQAKEYQALARQTSEIKLMLTGVFQKLKAER